MQSGRSFRIEDILTEVVSKETTKPKAKNEAQMTTVRRPILLPRVQPMIWAQRMSNCCNVPPNCVHARQPSACYTPWYYGRNPLGTQGENIISTQKLSDCQRSEKWSGFLLLAIITPELSEWSFISLIITCYSPWKICSINKSVKKRI